MSEKLTLDVGIDLDGCVYDFVEAMALFAARYLKRPITDFPSASRWNFYLDWGLTLEEFTEIYAAGVNDGEVLWAGKPYDQTVEGWSAIRTAGHRIHILTDRSPHGAVDLAHEATKYWLDTWGLRYETLTFTPDKTKILQVAKNPELVTFIEDRVENYVALREAGVNAVLMTRDWNKDHNAQRVPTLVDYAEYVKVISKR